MQTIRIIPHKYWQHTSGRRASRFGSAPWTNDADKANWTITQAGYTWELTDYRGTVTYGLGRAAADTKEAALRIAHLYARDIPNTTII
jgi:hypothetical protein